MLILRLHLPHLIRSLTRDCRLRDGGYQRRDGFNRQPVGAVTALATASPGHREILDTDNTDLCLRFQKVIGVSPEHL